jgi:hypothetical protein
MRYAPLRPCLALPINSKLLNPKGYLPEFHLIWGNLLQNIISHGKIIDLKELLQVCIFIEIAENLPWKFLNYYPHF